MGDAFTRLYADAASCCATMLGYMNSVLCEDRSHGMSNGTGLYYPIDGGICGEFFICGWAFDCHSGTIVR